MFDIIIENISSSQNYYLNLRKKKKLKHKNLNYKKLVLKLWQVQTNQRSCKLKINKIYYNILCK